MAKSRRDTSRKENLAKFKENQKNQKQMPQAQVPESKPFRQVPQWDSNETFEIQGVELEAIYNFTNIFAPLFGAVQQIFAKGVQSGKIKIGYEYEDGTPVSSDEVSEYTKKLSEYFKQRQEEETAKKSSDGQATKSKIVSFTGEPVESETAVD